MCLDARATWFPNSHIPLACRACKVPENGNLYLKPSVMQRRFGNSLCCIGERRVSRGDSASWFGKQWQPDVLPSIYRSRLPQSELSVQIQSRRGRAYSAVRFDGCGPTAIARSLRIAGCLVSNDFQHSYRVMGDGGGPWICLKHCVHMGHCGAHPESWIPIVVEPMMAPYCLGQVSLWDVASVDHAVVELVHQPHCVVCDGHR